MAGSFIVRLDLKAALKGSRQLLTWESFFGIPEVSSGRSFRDRALGVSGQY